MKKKFRKKIFLFRKKIEENLQEKRFVEIFFRKKNFQITFWEKVLENKIKLEKKN